MAAARRAARSLAFPELRCVPVPVPCQPAPLPSCPLLPFLSPTGTGFPARTVQITTAGSWAGSPANRWDGRHAPRCRSCSGCA